MVCASTRWLATVPVPPGGFPAFGACDVVGGCVATVAEGLGWRCHGWNQPRCGESGQSAADDVAGIRRGRTVALGKRPALISPDDHLAGGVHTRVQFHDVPGPIALPRGHLVLARILQAHRLAHGLRQQRRVKAHHVIAVTPIAARSLDEEDLYIRGGYAQNHRHTVTLGINPLRGRPDLRRGARAAASLNVGDRAGAS